MPLEEEAGIVHSFQFSDISLSTENFIPFIKDMGGTVNSYLLEIIHEILDQLPEKCQIKGGFTVVDQFQADQDQQAIILGEQVFYTRQIIFKQLQHANQAAVFLCTAGKEVSDWISYEMKHGDMLDAYLIDLAGSLLVEAAVDKLAEKIETHAYREGLNTTNRYSPGYCGWDVAEQQSLFTFFPEGFCGVKLTDSSLMLPEKSVSGILGLGKEVKKNPYSCKHCDKTDCIYYFKREGAL